MAPPNKQTTKTKGPKATAAPKASTRLEVTVVDADSKAPLPKAKVVVTGGKVKQPAAKTNASGVWLSKAVGAGTYEVVVTLAHFGPQVTQPPPPAKPVLPVVGPVKVPVTIPATLTGVSTTPVPVVMVRAETTVLLPVVDESYSNTPLIGAKVKADKLAEQVTKYQKTVELVLAAGTHTVRVNKLGYSQCKATPPADVVSGKVTGMQSSANVMKNATTRDPGLVDYVINLVPPLGQKPIEIPLPMASDWNRVANGTGITVGGKKFSEWFNNTFMQDAKYTHPENSIDDVGAFEKVFGNIASFRKVPLTLEEFVALFNVIIHETGGDFAPILEGIYDRKAKKWKEASLRYYFEPDPSIPKKSYNQGANRRAGDLLSGRVGTVFSASPILTPPVPATPTAKAQPNDQAAIAQWNGTTFPASLGKVTKDNLRQCDFLKYIGRGYIQVTWHSNYLAANEFVRLLAAKYSQTGSNSDILDAISTDDMMAAIETEPAIAFALMTGWFDQGDRWARYHGVNALEWKKFATRVNAGANYAKYPKRCEDLRQAMIDAGPNLGP